MRESAVGIQMAWRRHRFRKRVQKRVEERLRLEKLAQMEQDKFEALRLQFGCEMDEVSVCTVSFTRA